MSAQSATRGTATSAELRAAADGWWLLLLWGLMTLLIGLFLISSPAVTVVMLFTLLGAYFVVGGVVDIISAVIQREAGWVWRLVVGILYVVAGLAVLGSPILSTLFGLKVLYLFLAFSAVFGGIVEIVRALMRIGKVGFGAVLGTLLLGILQLAIGLFLLENPIAGTIALVPIMGVFAIASGIVAMLGAFQVRNLGRAA